jgi:hypothetical protein
MVKLTEVEDEHFAEKPAATKNDALLASDDDDDYTDTGTAAPYPGGCPTVTLRVEMSTRNIKSSVPGCPPSIDPSISIPADHVLLRRLR